ncbi:MAG: hypothetical protein IPK12_11845 [Gemmatimonadetes bacterium]|nr:hypothetical protein [Gemmatimonadota bacterium]
MTAPTLPVLSGTELRGFQAILEAEAGIHLSDSKRSLVASRLARRLRHFGFDSYGEYLEHLQRHDPDGVERQVMIECMTTNKTDFFREPHHFTFLGEVAAPLWRAGRRLPRVWCSAASTGEEPYTLAMTLRSAFPEARWSAPPVLASDIDRQVLETGARATYPLERLQHLPGHQWRPHVLRGTGAQAGLVRMRPELRRMVEFTRINLKDPLWPLHGTFDAIFCRNVLIYFSRELQAELLERFAERLEPGGFLFLGHSEGLHGLTGRFEAVGQTVYQLAGGSPGPLARAHRPARRGTAHAGAPAPRIPGRTAAPGTAPAAPPAAADPSRRTVTAGEVEASAQPMVLTTILGSCVAVCLYDPVTLIGGMNHFMLPDTEREGGLPSRYGVQAMELLINKVMGLGGERRRLEAKAFGGANVLSAFAGERSVADANVAFIRKFLATEGIPLVAERLGGTEPLEVRFHTATGRAQVRTLEESRRRRIAQAEVRYQRRMAEPPPTADVTLFSDP